MASAPAQEAVSAAPEVGSHLMDLQLARVLVCSAKHAEALVVLERLMARCPPDAGLLHMRGVCLEACGSIPAAFASYMAALSLQPDLVPALISVGGVYKSRGMLVEALQSYRRARELQPDHAAIREALAVVLTDLGTKLKGTGDLQEALVHYRSAVELCPAYAPALYNLGVCYSEMRQLDEALMFYQKAIVAQPLYTQAHCNMGVIYKERGDLAGAVACYERALLAAPNFNIVQNNLAIALTDMGTRVKMEGRVAEGVALYERALAHNPRYADALYNLGVVYGESGQHDKAILMYELAVHFNPQCAEAQNNLGVVYKERDNCERAVQCYMAALLIRPNFPQSLNNLAVVYTSQGRAQDALALLMAAIQACPTYAEAYNNLGVLQRDVGAIHEAITSYSRCLELQPDARNAGQNRLLALNYIVPGEDPSVCRAHADWGEAFQSLHPPLPPVVHRSPSHSSGRPAGAAAVQDTLLLQQQQQVALCSVPLSARTVNGTAPPTLHQQQQQQQQQAGLATSAAAAAAAAAALHHHHTIAAAGNGNVPLPHHIASPLSSHSDASMSHAEQRPPLCHHHQHHDAAAAAAAAAARAHSMPAATIAPGAPFATAAGAAAFPPPSTSLPTSDAHLDPQAASPLSDQTGQRGWQPATSSSRSNSASTRGGDGGCGGGANGGHGSPSRTGGGGGGSRHDDSTPSSPSQSPPYATRRTESGKALLPHASGSTTAVAAASVLAASTPAVAIAPSACAAAAAPHVAASQVAIPFAAASDGSMASGPAYVSPRDAAASAGSTAAAMLQPIVSTSGSSGSSTCGPLDPERRLVLGYISPDLFTHSVSYFAEAPLTHHRPEQVHLIVYNCTPRHDPKTIHLRAAVQRAGGTWRDVAKLSEADLAATVREDGVDVLVELTGHTANNRLGVMARRPASVQATWIGYPNSTGLRSVDYRFTDDVCDPLDTTQTFVEELIRFPALPGRSRPGCFLCYTPSTDAPAVAPLPALANGFITFGSFNNLAKITPQVVSTWCQVLHRVPRSRLVLKNKPFACASARGHVLSHFLAEGIEAWRVDLLPLAPSNCDHLAAYGLMDISLDTFPYAGTTTTCESLYMGVPVVTLAGRCHAHNVGVSLLSTVDMVDAWVAKTHEQYVDLAVRHAGNITALAALRSTLRRDMLASPLCDGPVFTAQLEATYRMLWRRYVASQQAAGDAQGTASIVNGQAMAAPSPSGAHATAGQVVGQVAGQAGPQPPQSIGAGAGQMAGQEAGQAAAGPPHPLLQRLSELPAVDAAGQAAVHMAGQPAPQVAVPSFHTQTQKHIAQQQFIPPPASSSSPATLLSVPIKTPSASTSTPEAAVGCGSISCNGLTVTDKQTDMATADPHHQQQPRPANATSSSSPASGKAIAWQGFASSSASGVDGSCSGHSNGLNGARDGGSSVGGSDGQVAGVGTASQQQQQQQQQRYGSRQYDEASLGKGAVAGQQYDEASLGKGAVAGQQYGTSCGMIVK